MAGIGLRLQSVIAKGTYLQSLTAYLSSAVISSGPWLSSVIALSVLSTKVAAFLSTADRLLLFATITYAFGASLVISGAFQMILTRYLADRFYEADLNKVAPKARKKAAPNDVATMATAYIAVIAPTARDAPATPAFGEIARTCTGMLVAIAPLALCTLPFLFFAPFSLVYRLLAISLVITLTYIWMASVFLSADRDYIRILLIFVAAYGISIGGSVILGASFGIAGCLAGFLMGQVVCLSLLVARVYREFTAGPGINFSFLRYLRKYWDLGLIGLLYAIGIWSDNVIFWFAAHSITIAGFFHLNPEYDSAKLIAYLATIPASASFLVYLESNFYRHYRDYFKAIREKGALDRITAHQQGMSEAAQSGLARIALIQGSIGATLFLLAPNLAAALRLSAGWVQTMRLMTIGVSLQIIMFSVFILLLYLDERRPALTVVGSFAALNIACSLASLSLGPAYFGAGYLVGAGIATSIGLGYLADRLRRLNFLTFMVQPISESR